jgi:DNA-binding beta-propeller fold protein YncE
VYSPEGDYKFSWGSPGIDAGEFMRPHNIAFDNDDRVYVVDREAHRVQIFTGEGEFITMWNNIHRPDAMVLWQDHIYVGELNGIGGFDSPNMGHRVEVFDLTGKLVCRFGAAMEGEGPGEFVAPHGIAVDSEGSLYVAEVSYTIMGRQLDPPREMRSISKYKRRW